MPLHVNGIYLPEDSAQKNSEAEGEGCAMDLLTFDRTAYTAFIRKGTVYGDTVEYETTFGVKLISSGNARTFADFVGYRRCHANGTVETLNHEWEVNGRPLHQANVGQKNRKQSENGMDTAEGHTEAGRCAS